MILRFLPKIEKDDLQNSMSKTIEQHNVMFYTSSNTDHYCMPHKSPFGIICSINGLNNFRVNKKQVNLKGKSCRILNRGSDFEIDLPKTDSRETLLLFFKKEQLINVAQTNNLEVSDLLYFSDSREDIQDNLFIERNYFTDVFFITLLYNFIDISKRKNLYAEAEKEFVIYQILQYLINLNSASIKETDKLQSIKLSTRKELYKRLYCAYDYMQSAFDENITLNQLAGIANMNPYYFLRVFKELFDVTPHVCLTGIRLQKAASLLRESKLSVLEICFKCGFESPASFSHLFKRNFLTTPTAYRNTTKMSFFDK